MSIRHNWMEPMKWAFPATICAAALALPLCADAEQLAALSCNSITNALPTALYVGNSSRGGSEAYSGKLDEIRVSSVARSDDWIQATFDTIKENDKFTTYGVASENVKGFWLIIR